VTNDLPSGKEPFKQFDLFSDARRRNAAAAESLALTLEMPVAALGSREITMLRADCDDIARKVPGNGSIKRDNSQSVDDVSGRYYACTEVYHRKERVLFRDEYTNTDGGRSSALQRRTTVFQLPNNSRVVVESHCALSSVQIKLLKSNCTAFGVAVSSTEVKKIVQQLIEYELVQRSSAA
jgi:hypothetical protein